MQHGTAWRGMAFHSKASQGMAWHGMAFHSKASQGMAWHGSMVRSIAISAEQLQQQHTCACAPAPDTRAWGCCQWPGPAHRCGLQQDAKLRARSAGM